MAQYKKAILRYISETKFTDVIFIENSGFEMDTHEFDELSKEYNKRFEYIKGSICSEKVLAHGRSYGDAFLIHEALQLSELLKNADFFYKVTGRLFLENHKTILKSRNKGNEFVIYPGMGWCFTNFFKVNKKDYLDILDDVYLDCDEKSIHDIEICFYNRIKVSGLNVRCFQTYPFFGDAKMGGTGNYYSDRIPKRWVRNTMAFFQFFTFDTPSARLFSYIARLLGKPHYI